MKLNRNLVKAAMACILVFCLSAPLYAGSAQMELAKESVLEQILKRNTLRVGFSTFVPWAMKDKTGEFVGFEIDVAKKLAEDMGVKLDLVPTKWSGIIPALLTGKFDVIIGGMAMNPKRHLKVNFTDPYYYSGVGLVANRKACESFNPTKFEDFNRPDVVFGERTGSTPVDLIKRELPKAQIRLYDDQAPAYQELRMGRIHAIVGDPPKPFWEAAEYPELLYLPLGKIKLTKEPISFATRKSDHDWLTYLNNWITVQHARGWMDDRHTYWFTTKDWEHLVK